LINLQSFCATTRMRARSRLIANGDKPGAARGKAVERFRPVVGQRALGDDEIAALRQRAAAAGAWDVPNLYIASLPTSRRSCRWPWASPMS
jgi:hypothetical protein